MLKRPGFEEYRRKKHSYHIEESREVTVELSDRKLRSKDPYAMTAHGDGHSDDGGSDKVILSNGRSRVLHTTGHSKGLSVHDDVGNGGDDYGYQAWTGPTPPSKK